MFIGIDMGGTKIAAGIVRDGRVTKRIVVPTGADKGRKHVLGQLRFVIDQLSQGKRIAGIGMGIPGFYKGTRIVHMAHVQCMEGVDLKKALGIRTRFSIENDARCFTLAEHKFGAGKGTKHMVGITLGTGVGTGIIIDGKLYHGTNNAAGETGHSHILTANLQQPHAWEDFLGGPGIVHWHHVYGGREQRVTDIWTSKSKQSAKTQVHMVRLLAILATNIQWTLDPQVIVIGGGISQAPIIPAAQKYIAKDKLSYVKPVLKQAKLGQDAGIIGAVVALKK